MNRFVLGAGIAVAIALIVAGCKKDEAELTNDWNKHVESVQRYSARYPAFKGALDGRLTEAQKTFEEAKAVTDKDARAQKLAEANSRLTDVFAPFDNYEAATKALKEAAEKNTALPPGLNRVKDMAKAAETKASAAVNGAKPTNVGEAKVTLEEATGVLKNATEVLGGVDDFVKSSDELKALIADKDLLKLPPAQVKPLMDAANLARNTALSTVAAANPNNPAEFKTKLTQATAAMAKATEPLKKLKPAPAAAPAATVKPGTTPVKPGAPTTTATTATTTTTTTTAKPGASTTTAKPATTTSTAAPPPKAASTSAPPPKAASTSAPPPKK